MKIATQPLPEEESFKSQISTNIRFQMAELSCFEFWLLALICYFLLGIWHLFQIILPTLFPSQMAISILRGATQSPIR